MKKHCLLTLLAIIPIMVNAAAVEIDGVYYNLITKGNVAEVTNNPNKYTGTVSIPEKVNYNNVVYSVTSIGEDAFNGCSGLTSITIPNSVTSIGSEAFYGCSGLTSITIPNSVTSIGSYAFSGCSGLTSVTIPNSVTSIEGGAFSGCSGLTSIIIPNSVTSIGAAAFSGCSGLNSVHISDLAVWCKIKFVDGFSNPLCYAHHLFLNGTEIKDLVIPNSVTSIENYAFYNFSGLTSITIPNSVTSIGYYAFEGCTDLTSITIPNSVTSIRSEAFRNCSGLTSITIPNSVTSISYEAFYGCSGLTSITIPNSVTSIGDGAFSGCSGLTSITIPNSVTSIGNYAFIRCSGLTSITIPNSVTSIGNYAFNGCSGLTSITIPNSVTSIGDGAFLCSGLTSVTIGSSVKTMGGSSFASCPELTDVYCYAEKVPSTNSDVFSNSYIEYATLHVPASSVNSYKDTAPWSGFKSIVSLDGSTPEIPETPKCAKPTISYTNGRLSFSCNTEGVEYVTEITDADIKKHYDASISLSNTYNVSVYATKPGYDNSDVATATFSWNGIEPLVEGSIAKYRLSFIVDNKELSVRNVEYGATISAPSTDNEGNNVTWYIYPSTMPAHDLVVYGMVPKPVAPTKYTITYKVDGQTYKSVVVEEGANVSKEKAAYKEGYTFSGWQNEPTTMPGRDVSVTGSFTINSYRLAFIVDNEELSSRNVQYGANVTAPSKDSNGNDITWYTYPSTMPAHDLVVYGMSIKEPEPIEPEPQPEPDVFVWLTVNDSQSGYMKIKVKQGAEQTLNFTAEEGWKISNIFMDGRYVTSRLAEDGTFVTPAITSDASIIIMYEETVPSGARTATQSQAEIKVVSDGVVISNAEPDTRCAIYQTDGKQVVNTVIGEGTRKITLQLGQAYILTIDDRTLKFAL